VNSVANLAAESAARVVAPPGPALAEVVMADLLRLGADDVQMTSQILAMSASPKRPIGLK
jgi:hypothetical protein